MTGDPRAEFEATRSFEFADRYKDTEDDVVIVNSDWSVVRLSASLLAQKSDEEIRDSLRRLYAGKYRRRAAAR